MELFNHIANIIFTDTAVGNKPVPARAKLKAVDVLFTHLF